MFGNIYFDISEFIEIPSFRYYMINKEGIIYSAKNGTLLVLQQNKNNDKYVRMSNNEGKRKRKYIKNLFEVFKNKEQLYMNNHDFSENKIIQAI